MRVTRSRHWVVLVALSAVLMATRAVPAGPQPQKPMPSPNNKPRPGAVVEVKYIDDSTMKLKLLDEKLELVTKHGTLQIATADIRLIEFATRVPADMNAKVGAAVGKLASPDFKTRETATDELKGYREYAYLQLLKAKKSTDPEVSRRADELVDFIRNKVPAERLEIREFDVVHTDDSKISGRLTADALKVSTFQFGELKLKLTDVRELGTSLAKEAVVNAVPGPPHLAALEYQNQFGKEFVFSVTGAQPGVNHGAMWGTDTYTLDSSLPTAVVHAGLAKPGQTVVVRVRIIQSPPVFVGSTRHGVTSAAFGVYPTGAYQFIKK